ncbi:VF530 family DNA-binding protein [Sulfurospirillum arcachonense]|uniref:VF530 family protein n=1 Tax=Sulfurospirillum arcachonense TaxID=57666 RepID=UPI000468721D|nr:VF530 family protein [Sulfurospirillum arcachonense]
MTDEHPNNPLHGIKLQQIVEDLEEKYGWEELDKRMKMNCFHSNPSVKSTLKFLRRTEWAREKIENLWLRTFKN